MRTPALALGLLLTVTSATAQVTMFDGSILAEASLAVGVESTGVSFYEAQLFADPDGTVGGVLDRCLETTDTTGPIFRPGFAQACGRGEAQVTVTGATIDASGAISSSVVRDGIWASASTNNRVDLEVLLIITSDTDYTLAGTLNATLGSHIVRLDRYDPQTGAGLGNVALLTNISPTVNQSGTLTPGNYRLQGFISTIANPSAPDFNLTLDFPSLTSLDSCPGDVDADNDVDLSDLSTLLSNFGLADATRGNGDVDRDGVVGLSDLALLLSLFGSQC